MDAPANPTTMTMSVSDPALLRSLREHLRRIADVEVTQIPGEPPPGSLGVVDTLQAAAAGGTALAAVIAAVAQLVKSRRSSVTVTIRSGEHTVEISEGNVKDPKDVIDRLLGDA